LLLPFSFFLSFEAKCFLLSFFLVCILCLSNVRCKSIGRNFWVCRDSELKGHFRVLDNQFAKECRTNEWEANLSFSFFSLFFLLFLFVFDDLFAVRQSLLSRQMNGLGNTCYCIFLPGREKNKKIVLAKELRSRHHLSHMIKVWA